MADLIVAVMVLAAAGMAIASIIKEKKRGNSCGDCTSCGKCANKEKNTQKILVKNTKKH